MQGSFPFTYLGVSVDSVRRWVRHFQHIIDHIAERAKGWQSKLMSDAGRLVLIKHVLSSIPMHILSATSIPKTCLKKIESILGNFFGVIMIMRKRGTGANDPLYAHQLMRVVRAFMICATYTRPSSLRNVVWQPPPTLYDGSSCVPSTRSLPLLFFGATFLLGSLELREMVDLCLAFASRCGWRVSIGDVSFWHDN